MSNQQNSRPSGIPMPSRSGTPTQMHRPSGLPRPAGGASTLPRVESRRPSLTSSGSLNSIQATAMANAVAAANSRIPTPLRKSSMDAALNGLNAVPAATLNNSNNNTTTAIPKKSTITTTASASSSTTSVNNINNADSNSNIAGGEASNTGGTRIVRTSSAGSGGMVPKSPLTIVREEKNGNVSDDSYEDEEVLAITGGIAGVDQMRQRTATQTLADFLRTTGPQDYGMATQRPPSRAQTPVKKRRGLFFRRKKKQPIRTASPAPGSIPRLQDTSADSGNKAPSGIPVPSSIGQPSQIARPMSPAHRGGSWRLRRKFVALMPGLPGQPQLRTRPPSALRNRVDISEKPALIPTTNNQGKQSLEMVAATNAAKNAFLSIPGNTGFSQNASAASSPSGSPVLAPQSINESSVPAVGRTSMEEPLSPVGKSLTSFQSEFSAALAAFLQRPDGAGMSASSRIAAFQAAYGDIRLEDTYKRKRKVQFSRTDDLIDEEMKIPSKAATEQVDECDSAVDDDSVDDSNIDEDEDIFVTLETPINGAKSNILNPSTRRLTASNSKTVGVQVDLHGLCQQCERRLSSPIAATAPTQAKTTNTTENYSINGYPGLYGQDGDDNSELGRSISPPPAYQSSTMNEFLGMVRTARRSVRHMQVQTSASCFSPDMVIAADALAPQPPPPPKVNMSTQTVKFSTVGRGAGGNTVANSPLMALARRHRRLLSDTISTNSSVSSLLLDTGLETDDDYDEYGNRSGANDSEGSRLAINVLMSQQSDLRGRLEDAEELLRVERRDRERLETAMTQARAKFDGVSAQAYKAIRSLMEERSVLMDEVQRLRRFANELLNTSVMAANSANAATTSTPNSNMDRNLMVIDGDDDDDDGYVDTDSPTFSATPYGQPMSPADIKQLTVLPPATIVTTNTTRNGGGGGAKKKLRFYDH
ncbi:hypothetical protein BDF19DRAFT_426333 [Syncephalis fuscata]|nr:hypothetical protein BDF19DRAFT_426333 [Syncephalis fuscata]